MSELERAARAYQRVALQNEDVYRAGGTPTKDQREDLNEAIDELLSCALLLPPE